jgi:hypothetical protein
MSETQQEPKAEQKPGEKPVPVIHRVCTTCNNMFVVTLEKVDTKICPICHKG